MALPVLFVLNRSHLALCDMFAYSSIILIYPGFDPCKALHCKKKEINNSLLLSGT